MCSKVIITAPLFCTATTQVIDQRLFREDVNRLRSMAGVGLFQDQETGGVRFVSGRRTQQPVALGEEVVATYTLLKTHKAASMMTDPIDERKLDFRRLPSVLQHLLAPDPLTDVLKLFIVDQFLDTDLVSKSGDQFFPMCRGRLEQIGRHTDLDRPAATAGHDVDKGSHRNHARIPSIGEQTCFRKNDRVRMSPDHVGQVAGYLTPAAVNIVPVQIIGRNLKGVYPSRLLTIWILIDIFMLESNRMSSTRSLVWSIVVLFSGLFFASMVFASRDESDSAKPT